MGVIPASVVEAAELACKSLIYRIVFDNSDTHKPKIFGSLKKRMLTGLTYGYPLLAAIDLYNSGQEVNHLSLSKNSDHSLVTNAVADTPHSLLSIAIDEELKVLKDYATWVAYDQCRVRMERPISDPMEFFAGVSGMYSDMVSANLRGQIRDISDIAADILTEEDYNALVEPDFDWGIESMMRNVPIKRGNLVIIGGRPSMGKTAFALNLARTASAVCDLQTGVGIVSLEMQDSQMVKRLGLSAAGDPDLSGWERFQAGRMLLHYNKIYLDGSRTHDLESLKWTITEFVRQNNCGMVLIDYLQLISIPREDGGVRVTSESQGYGVISRELKLLAMKLGIAIVCLSQLNRECEAQTNERNGFRPKMSHLRASGNLEQDADIILLLYRPYFYGLHLAQETHQYTLEVICAKVRESSVGTVKLIYDLHTQQIKRYREEY